VPSRAFLSRPSAVHARVVWGADELCRHDRQL